MALGTKEILLIGLALLVFFGPSKLPEVGAALGKGLREFKKAGKELTGEDSEQDPKDPP